MRVWELLHIFSEQRNTLLLEISLKMFHCFSWREDRWDHLSARVSAGYEREPGASAAVHVLQEDQDAPDQLQGGVGGQPEGSHAPDPGLGSPLQASVSEAPRREL